ncbi:MAG: DUF805 domain-containing protein [Elusimicrobiota bacterium]|jgi:uncharacterized membrane protein YhaH (DUF805 family)|nr:DUF805 domain-containing protein [Elusimicrobiota bacterium]
MKRFFVEYFFNVVTKQYVDFSGCASRKQFLLFYLFNILFAFIITFLSGIPQVYELYMILVALPSFAIGARRLHDINMSGWWQLLFIVPVFGLIVLMILFAIPSKEKNNFWKTQEVFKIFVEYFWNVITKHYSNFNGCVSRKPFWIFYLINILVAIAVSAIAANVDNIGMLTSRIYPILIAVPTFAIGARRLHDINMSGWWQLLFLLPVVGTIVMLVLYAIPTKEKCNLDNAEMRTAVQ